MVFLVENFGALRAAPPPSHSRCASLDTLAPSTPCFGRFRCDKNNKQLFLSCYPVLQEIKTKALYGLFKSLGNPGLLFYPVSNRGRQSMALPYRAKNSHLGCFYNALTVLQEIITAQRQLSKKPDTIKVFGVFFLPKFRFWCKLTWHRCKL